MNQYQSRGLPRNQLSILWGGHPTRPKYETGKDTHPTRKFGMFFIWNPQLQIT